MESIKEFIKSIIKYVIAGVIISAIAIIICLILGKNYLEISNYVILAVVLIALLAIVGSYKITYNANTSKYITGVDEVPANSSSVLESIFRAVKLVITVAVIYGISVIYKILL